MLQLSSGWKWRSYFPSWYQISIYAEANWEAIESIEKLCGGWRMKLYVRKILWGWSEFPPPLQAVCLPSFCLFIGYLQYKSCSLLDDLRTLWGQGWAIEVSSPPVCLPFDWLSDDDILFSKRMQDIVGVALSHWRRFCLFSRPKTSYNTSSCWLLVFLFSLQIIFITFNVKQVFTSS